MLLEVLSEGHGVVRGHLGAAREDLLDGLVETGNNHDRGALRLHHLAEVRGLRLRRGVAGNLAHVLQGRILLHSNLRLGVQVGYGEVVLLLTLVGCGDVVDDDVVAVSVHASDQRIPGGLDELGGHAQILSDQVGDFLLEADQGAVRVVEREGAVGALQAHTNLAGRLDSLQLVGAGCGGAAAGRTARCEQCS